MAGMKDALAQLAKITRGQLTRSGVKPDSRLETVLGNMDAGEGEALGRLPGALISAASSRLYAPNFFARYPVEVAEALCGSSLAYVDKINNSWSGLVTEVAAYKTSSNKDEVIANSLPGTIGLYPVQGKNVLIISAHEPGKSGTVAVWGLGLGENLSMTRVTELMNAESYVGTIMGINNPIYLQPRDCTNNQVGNLKVTNVGKEKGAAAIYKLTRV